MPYSPALRSLAASVLLALAAGCGGSADAPPGSTRAVGDAADDTTRARIAAAAADTSTAVPITWTQLEYAAMTPTGGIVKAPGGWYAAGVSSQALTADGALEFVANDTGLQPLRNASRVCLDSGTHDVHTPATLDYCVIPGAGVASVYVRGAWRSDTPLTTTDTVSIVIDGATVRFSKNGQTFHSVAEAPKFPQVAVFSTNFDGYGLSRAALKQTAAVPTPVAPSTTPVVWGSLVQAAPDAAGGVVKNAGPSWYGAATSTQPLDGAGRFEFAVNNVGSAPPVNAGRVCLDSGTFNVDQPASFDYCLVPGAGVATVYVRGAWRADVPITTADVLGIVVESGAVRFQKNGTAFLGVAETPPASLNAVWTSNFDGYGLTKAS